MTVAERLSRRVELSFAGRRWRLLFTNAVLLDIEEATGSAVLSGEFDPLGLSARELRAAIVALLRRAGGEYGAEDVGRRLGMGGLPGARKALIDAWIASMPDREPGQAPIAEGRTLGWIEAFAVANQDLGLRTEEWLDLTPRIVHALNHQHLESVRQWELLAGQIIAFNAHYSMNPPKRMLNPRSLMLHPWPEADTERGSIGDRIMQEMKRLRQ